MCTVVFFTQQTSCCCKKKELGVRNFLKVLTKKGNLLSIICKDAYMKCGEIKLYTSIGFKVYILHTLSSLKPLNSSPLFGIQKCPTAPTGSLSIKFIGLCVSIGSSQVTQA